MRRKDWGINITAYWAHKFSTPLFIHKPDELIPALFPMLTLPILKVFHQSRLYNHPASDSFCRVALLLSNLKMQVQRAKFWLSVVNSPCHLHPSNEKCMRGYWFWIFSFVEFRLTHVDKSYPLADDSIWMFCAGFLYLWWGVGEEVEVSITLCCLNARGRYLLCPRLLDHLTRNSQITMVYDCGRSVKLSFGWVKSQHQNCWLLFSS